MDSFSCSVGSKFVTLIAFALFVFSFGVFLPPSFGGVAYAQTTTYAQAMAACVAWSKSENYATTPSATCEGDQYNPPSTCSVGLYLGAADVPEYAQKPGFINTWNYSCTTVQQSNPCSGLTGSTVPGITVSPGQTLGTIGQTWTQDPSSGGYVACPYNITYSNGGQCVVTSTGTCTVTATISYTGLTASSNESTSPATPVGTPEYDNSSGQLASPQPQTSSSAPPNICGGQSCFDPSTQQFCATDAGGQFCVPMSSADTSQGGCSSLAGSTICAGSPTPPSPVGTSGSQITSPPTQIAGQDNYPTGNVQGGGTGNIGVSVYNPPGGSSSSGSTSTSVKTGGKTTSSGSGPASSSSSGSSDSFGAGSDCNTPPVCSGDAVLCGISLQDWQSMCYQNNLLVGNGQQPPTFQSDQTKYSQSNVWTTPTVGNTTGDQANQGTYDASGFGYSTTCPLVDKTIPLMGGSFVFPFSQGCALGTTLYWVILACAYITAAIITAGGRS
ncbi:hypothetical protein EKH79_03110 [Dyella dinghuensis]|uniref:Uncharacterized protein n=1 Tax=Dyella dinghuensis TaxID=1920169 RepID=A0A3S0PJ36_9GAMM|nr:virulence factor TspB C-terminal domain-related protein [Dyella dinghuensis]RUL66814.1 hypothetical protein EKH79_03110 [Dyella dinghuensis]